MINKTDNSSCEKKWSEKVIGDAYTPYEGRSLAAYFMRIPSPGYTYVLMGLPLSAQTRRMLTAFPPFVITLVMQSDIICWLHSGSESEITISILDLAPSNEPKGKAEYEL